MWSDDSKREQYCPFDRNDHLAQLDSDYNALGERETQRRSFHPFRRLGFVEDGQRYIT